MRITGVERRDSAFTHNFAHRICGYRALPYTKISATSDLTAALATPRWGNGGVEGDRTLDLRIANATLSQLSYHPMEAVDFTVVAATRTTKEQRRLDAGGGFLLLLSIGHDLLVALGAYRALVSYPGKRPERRPGPGVLAVKAIFKRIQVPHFIPSILRIPSLVGRVGFEPTTKGL
jgi:hypothetical protein